MNNKLSNIYKNISKDNLIKIGLVTIAAIVYIIRGYRYIINPQLFAEDGQEWLAGGYNEGFSSLTRPLNGFLHTIERIFGLIVAQLPLQFAPFIFNFTAFIIFCTTVYYIISTRTKILSSTYERVFMVLTICLIANVDEFFFNFSNSVFLLGIVGILILISNVSKNRVVEYLEKVLYALICFTLPFSILYTPIVIIEKFKNTRKSSFYLYITILGAAAQLITYLLSSTVRSNVTVPSLFSKYTLLEIYNQIIIPSTRFARIDYNFVTSSNRYMGIAIVFAICIFIAMAVYVIITSNKQVRYFLLFLILMSAISLTSPLVGLNYTAEETIKIMSTTFNGDRYFIFGILASTLIIVKFSYYLISAKFRYVFILVFISFGLITSLQYQSFNVNRNLKNLSEEYYTGVKNIESKKSETVKIPINPQYENAGWYILLNKK